MTKKMIKIEDLFESNITGWSSLKYVKDEVERLINLFGENALVDFDSGYNNISETISYLREETDSEYAKRLKDEERQSKSKVKKKEESEQRERKEFERLKKKFESE